jgi:hypothetical protein
MSWFQDFASNPINPLNILSAAFSHPIKTLENPIAASQQTLNEGPAKTITNTVVNTAIASAAILSAGAALAPESAVGSAGSTIIKAAIANPKTALVTAAAIPIVTGIVASAPTKSFNAVSSVPRNLANFGSNVGNVIQNPSISSVTTLVKENPIISAGVALAGVGAAGYGLSGIVSNVLNTEAVKKNTAATLASANNSSIQVDPSKTDYTAAELQQIIDQRIKESTPKAAANVVTPPIVSPVTPTAIVKKTTKKKKKATSKKKKKKKTTKKKVYKKKKTTKHKKAKKKK